MAEPTSLPAREGGGCSCPAPATPGSLCHPRVPLSPQPSPWALHMAKTKAQSGKGFTVGQSCYKMNSFIYWSQIRRRTMRWQEHLVAPGPTASQASPQGPSAPSGSVSPLQEAPVTFQLLWKAFQCCFRDSSGSRTGSSTSGYCLWADVTPQPTPSLKNPHQGERGEEVGFLFHTSCTLAVQRLKVPLPVPCQEPLVPSAFPGTATPGSVCSLFHLQRFIFFSRTQQRLGRGFSFLFSFPAPAQ